MRGDRVYPIYLIQQRSQLGKKLLSKGAGILRGPGAERHFSIREGLLDDHIPLRLIEARTPTFNKEMALSLLSGGPGQGATGSLLIPLHKQALQAPEA